MLRLVRLTLFTSTSLFTVASRPIFALDTLYRNTYTYIRYDDSLLFNGIHLSISRRWWHAILGTVRTTSNTWIILTETDVASRPFIILTGTGTSRCHILCTFTIYNELAIHRSEQFLRSRESMKVKERNDDIELGIRSMSDFTEARRVDNRPFPIFRTGKRRTLEDISRRMRSSSRYRASV